ncbi:MAG TPA: hypothetical protein VGJ78_12910 [Vicinamibacterales bacterium]|jgi:hypothetical protein
MPPRYAYWTIIAGGLPTAFRAADRDELLPTFQRIKGKHPDAQMKYFARGKLWESQDAARAALRRGDDRRARPADRSARPPGSDRGARPPGIVSAEARSAQAEGRPEQRSRDWRPGGEHRDPRQKFIDAKKNRNAARREDRWRRKQAEGVKSQGAGFSAGQRKRPAGKKPWVRAQGTEEPQPPPRPRGPDHEPPPNEEPKPTPPPRPEQPIVPPPGPPERGAHARRPFRPRGRFSKGPRR